MITATREIYDTNLVYPFILKDEREEDNPTIWGLNLMAPEKVNFYTGLMASCVGKRDGFRGDTDDFNDKKFSKTEVKRITECLQYLENVVYRKDGESIYYKRIDKNTEENEKLISDIVSTQDADTRTELGNACSKKTAMLAGVKKNWLSSHGLLFSNKIPDNSKPGIATSAAPSEATT